MKRILLSAIFLALISPGVATARQSSKPSQEKPLAQEKLLAQEKPLAQPPAPGQNERRPANTVRVRSRTITGRVVDEGNQPIEDATIVTFPAGLVNSSQNATMAARIRPATTDERGNFAIENVAPGAYMIIANVPGYVRAPDINDDRREQKYYRPGDTLTLRMIKGGVITGTVTSSTGEPVVGVRVNPIRLRDLKGRAAHQTAFDLEREWKTDDRGIYRIFGLEPGTYIISTGGKGIMPFLTSGYDADAPTYYPSATRDAAGEVMVHSGEEMSGIDIRYRDSRGHAISGNITVAAAATGMTVVSVVLSDAMTESFIGLAITPMAPGAHGFTFDAVPDGEYVLIATASDYTAGSPPRRVTVKGGDITGLELALAPYGSITGRVVLEALEGAERKPECQGKRASPIEEAVILARLDEKSKTKEQLSAGKGFSLFPFPIDSTPNNKGEFKLGMLEAARYHIEPRFPSEDWYIRSIMLPASAEPATAEPAAAQPAAAQDKPPFDAARNGISLKSGDRIVGLTITLSEGAAALRGRVVSASDSTRLPDRLRVHLVPAEKESADETLRFAEAPLQSGGLFAFSNLSPGKYWIVIRRDADKTQSPDQQQSSTDLRPVAWDKEGRAKLVKEGEAANTMKELTPCQRIADYVLRYSPPPGKSQSKPAESKRP